MGIQSLSSKKKGSSRRMHPICGSSVGPIECFLYFPILRRTSSSDLAPLPSPKASHARLTGSRRNFVKNPPPTMKFRGACNLNKNGSPHCKALKVAVEDGRQKLTSSTTGLDEWSLNQS